MLMFIAYNRHTHFIGCFVNDRPATVNEYESYRNGGPKPKGFRIEYYARIL